MECKLLDKEDIELMEQFVDDENTKYDKEKLMGFLNENNSYGFIVKNENRIVGFAYGYVLLRPDGNQDFYLHAIDIISEFQGKGYGTKGLGLTLNLARQIVPEDEIYLRVLKSNIPSFKAISNNGAYIAGEDEEHYLMRVKK